MFSIKKTLLTLNLIFLSANAWSKNSYTVKTDNLSLKKNLTSIITLNTQHSQEKITSKINAYLMKNGYYIASIKVKDGIITIKNPIKWELFFEGNTFYSRYFLKKSLINSVFSTISETLVPEFEQSLTKTYKAAGFHFAEIKSELKHYPKKKLTQLIFKIKEHEIVKIKKISISGSLGPFKKKDFLSKLKRFSEKQISKGIYYDKALLSGIASLKNHLYNLGYFHAYVGIKTLKFNTQKNKISVGIKLYINSPTIISSITFKDNKKISSFWLKELLNLKKGDILNLNTFEAGLNLIENYYLQRGFLNVHIQTDDFFKYFNALKTAKITISIKENSQILISRINIKGNFKTKRSLILKEITFKPGEVLTADKINTSRNNLIRLGFFSNIQFNILSNEEKKVSTLVEIILSERKPGIFTSGFGLSSELNLTVKTFAGFEYKNIQGTGRSFSNRIELKRPIRKIDYLENRIFASYLEPYLFKSSVKGRINLSRNDEIWDIAVDKKSFTVINSNRLDLILEQQLTKHMTLFITPFSLDIRKEEVITDIKNPKKDELHEIIGSISPSIQIDYRNNPFLPTTGSLSKIQIEYASPFLGSNTQSKKDLATDATERVSLEFLKFQSSYTFYKPLSNNLIWAQSFRGGYLYNYSGKKTNGFTPFPKSRAFFLGGASTLRGFDPSQSNERIPSDKYLEDNGGILSGNTIGGGVLNIPKSSYYYLTKTEVRFPLSKNNNWWGSAFYDGGSVQITNLNENYDSWRHSVGIGLRFNTPVGPLFNAEIAYKLDRKTQRNESTIEFHLSVSSF